MEVIIYILAGLLGVIAPNIIRVIRRKNKCNSTQYIQADKAKLDIKQARLDDVIHLQRIYNLLIIKHAESLSLEALIRFKTIIKNLEEVANNE